jgi:hypothetical protein
MSYKRIFLKNSTSGNLKADTQINPISIGEKNRQH